MSAFRRQVSILKSIGSVVPLAEAMTALSEGRPLARRSVALTFDDGYRDTRIAMSVLEEMGVPATFFLIPKLLDGCNIAWWEKLSWAFAEATSRNISWGGTSRPVPLTGRRRLLLEVCSGLKRLKHIDRMMNVERLVADLKPSGDFRSGDYFIDWQDARSLVGRGFSVGSHSMSHSILGNESSVSQLSDLKESKARLEQELQTEVRSVAYPNGRWEDFNGVTVSAASAAGYSLGVTTQPGINTESTSPLLVRRVMLDPNENIVTAGARRAIARALRRGAVGVR